MSLAEIAGRGRQEAAKRIDRFAQAAGLNGYGTRPALEKLIDKRARRGDGTRGINGDRAELARRLHARFRDREDKRGFFEGAESPHTAALIAKRFPATRDGIIDAADRICRKRFDLLGYKDLFFGDPVDWRLDPVHGRRAPGAHFSRIDPLEADRLGDSKIIWELGRHQWALKLGQAHRLTGDERYAESFIGMLCDWMQANPPGSGIHWASSLEVAYRLMSWCWSLFLFRDSKAISPARYAELLGWVRIHAGHVERYLSYFFSPNTHLTGEALGLFYAGVVFPELKGAGRWRNLGAAILVDQIERQVHRDGVYFEQATHYQRYTAEICLQFLILAQRNRIELPPAVAERTVRLVDFLVALMRPDRTLPQIGDADGGALLPLVARTPEDFTGVFSTAAVFFRRADYAWAAGALAPETLWLCGLPSVGIFESLQAAPPAEESPHIFPQGGYAVLRSGWDQSGHQLIFDAGPLGCPVSGAHGHADLLSIQCAAYGESHLVDPGTFCYTGDASWRDHFRSTAAHNTVLVDGLSQADPAGPFSWKRRPRARFRNRVSCPGFDLIDADHDAYAGLPDPVRHRRRVVFAGRRYFLVVDDLEGDAEHRIELRFQFAPLAVSLDTGGWVRSRGASGRGLLLRAFSAARLESRLDQGRNDPPLGWVSPDYGRREPAPAVTFEATARLPLRIATLLLPTPDPDGPLPQVSQLGRDMLSGLELVQRSERVCISAHDIYLEDMESPERVSAAHSA